MNTIRPILSESLVAVTLYSLTFRNSSMRFSRRVLASVMLFIKSSVLSSRFKLLAPFSLLEPAPYLDEYFADKREAFSSIDKLAGFEASVLPFLVVGIEKYRKCSGTAYIK